MSTLRRSLSSFGSYADGVGLRGMPILGLYPGNVYWVDSNGGGSSKGTIASPVATLAAATALCTADNGDYVMIKPGHAETITGAGGITFDKAGVSYIGMGRYTDRPTFLMDGATTVTCLVTAANVGVYNCHFKAGHSDIVTFSTITGKGCTFSDCQFSDNTTSENFISVFNCGAATDDFSGLSLINNTMNFREDAETLLPINLLKGSYDVRIIGNRLQFKGDSGAFGGIYSVNTLHHYNCEVAYNLIHNTDAANNSICISIGSTTSTGWIHHNLAYGEDTTGFTPFVTTATGMALFENYYTYDGGTLSGALIPASA